MAYNAPTLEDFNKLSTIQEKMVFLLDDTVKYYSENVKRRSINKDGKCFYRSGRNACAIGRFLTKDKAEFCDSQMNNSVGGIYGHLPFVLAQFDRTFLKAIQSLHDKKQHWNEKAGLSSEGHEKYIEIKKDFNLKGISII